MATVPLSFLAGWAVATVTYRVRRRPRLEEVSAFMDRVVNVEELESGIRLRRAAIMRSGRRTVRADGGPPAKVMRMRVRRRNSAKRSANP